MTVRTDAQGGLGGGGRAPDIAGEWRLDQGEDPGQPPGADYLGLALNEAGRFRADSTPESYWGTPEYQCRPHSAPHQWRGVGGARILKELDPISRDILGFRVQFMRSLDRPIYLDDRPHPPAWAPHSWSGFSTAEWEGQTLKITTTHLKDGFLKRGGSQTSDMLTMTEYLTRHDDILTIVQVVDDPIYLDEPYVLSITYSYDPNAGPATENCSGNPYAENGGTDRHHVPHFLPGQNNAIGEFIKTENWIPFEPIRGGVKTIYPEYRAVLNKTATTESITVPVSKSANDEKKAIADQSPRDGQVHVLPVQGNIYMLVADGTNITASIGRDGISIVNTGSAQMSDKILAALNDLAKNTVNAPMPNTCFGANCPSPFGQPAWSSPYFNAFVASPRPPQGMRFVFNTSASPENAGGNEKLAAAANFKRAGGAGGFGSAVRELGTSATIVARQEVLDRLSNSKPAAPEGAWPTDTYFDSFYKLTEYVNGEPVILYHAPAANTDGDSFVLFRGSDVVSAGDVFTPGSFPFIDIASGGSVQGEIAALNHLLQLTVPAHTQEGGTYVVPGHGRLSDEADVVEFRDMIVIVRDRVQDMIKKGMTLDQIKAARPSRDYDPGYVTPQSFVKADQFVESIYKGLVAR